MNYMIYYCSFYNNCIYYYYYYHYYLNAQRMRSLYLIIPFLYLQILLVKKKETFQIWRRFKVCGFTVSLIPCLNSQIQVLKKRKVLILTKFIFTQAYKKDVFFVKYRYCKFKSSPSPWPFPFLKLKSQNYITIG